MHIDIDPAEIGKNKQPHVSLCADVKPALALINSIIADRQAAGALHLDFSAWQAETSEQKALWPLKFPVPAPEDGAEAQELIVPQLAIRTLYEITGGEAIISTGVGQHQMWAAQFFKYRQPRRWLTSGGTYTCS